jgi:hypothetical protein
MNYLGVPETSAWLSESTCLSGISIEKFITASDAVDGHLIAILNDEMEFKAGGKPQVSASRSQG